VISQTSESTGRPRRRDLVRRIQVGVTGLFLVALLVGLSTLLTGEAREDAAEAEARAAAAGAPPVATTNDDPLTNLGVEATSQPTASPPAMPADRGDPATRTPATPIVPDLEPDPRLQTTVQR
jgi:hypothetical protein